MKASLAGDQMLGEKGCIQERFNRRQVGVPLRVMHVGEPQMTVVKKRDNDINIFFLKSCHRKNHSGENK